MFKISLMIAALVGSLAGLLSCNSSPKEKPLSDSNNISTASAASTDFHYRDQRQIEKVIYGFCENFDNGELNKCVAYMDDNIRGEIDGVKLKGKQNWTAKIDSLLLSVHNSHYQQRHMITNMQFTPGMNDTVKISMYASCLWTDLTNGQIQLMSVGYYKGKVVKKGDEWYITVLNSLPDSRLVKQFYHDVRVDAPVLK
ncbi:SnoaL-like domain-containing protein [Chitinophaga polysaccharea]|uniref:nuclear transport factor 2 family protein n=1 Tax=Chitinophaga polysaccharea TaxID=1293035 RepID=UPI001455AE03|nr:nuclear transport factor 2 family protein [Chitinophaga polysaccharea]NLR58425.1 SnoaL-like domain-containing protein [Chitinophaga polysaccharea]